MSKFSNVSLSEISIKESILSLYFGTLAGTAGVTGSTNGTGSAARFYNPQGVAADTSGNVFVADTYNHTIRKVTSAGVVTLIAGTAGVTGSTDGTGSAARFSAPYGIDVDTAGNVFVADADNRTIRKVTSGGVVTTLAGLAGTSGSTDGTGSAARFNGPYGIGVDTAGNVFVADVGNNNIRKVTSAGVVTTLAGLAGTSGSTDGTGSAARFNGPVGLSLDSAGNLFVAEAGNNTIRKVTSAGVVTTLADGTGSAITFFSPTGTAVDAAGNVFVSVGADHTIRKVTSAGVVTLIAGTAGVTGSTDGTGSAARFYVPYDIDVDTAGRLYVADSFNHTIRSST